MDDKKPLLYEEEEEVLEENTETVEVPEKKPEDKCIRIVLVGKSGNGKSATANTIIGEKKFKSKTSSSPVTTECQKETLLFDGKKLAVIDTPGFFDTKITGMQVKREAEKQMQIQGDTSMQVKREMEERLQREKENRNKEIAKCIAFAAPGPHVFLVVMQAARFTKEDQETVETIQEIFGEGAAKYTMALFTRGDDLEEDGIEDFKEDMIKKNEHLNDFIQMCGERFHVFNNRDKDPSQVRELLCKINTMSQENGKKEYYTNEMFQEAEKAIIEKKRRLLEENPTMSPEEARRQAERDNQVIRRLKRYIAGFGAAGIGAGIGIGIGIGIESAVVGAAAGTIGGPVGLVAGALVGLAVGGVIADLSYDLS